MKARLPKSRKSKEDRTRLFGRKKALLFERTHCDNILMSSPRNTRKAVAVHRRQRDLQVSSISNEPGPSKRLKQESAEEILSRLASEALNALQESLKQEHRGTKSPNHAERTRPISSRGKPSSSVNAELPPPLPPHKFLKKAGLDSVARPMRKSQHSGQHMSSSVSPPKFIDLRYLDTKCTESPCSTPSSSPLVRPSVGNVTPATAQAARYLLQLNQ
ncbi:hypothetical protein BWQ96_05560 [Gracilariopsis chorda]|uniref:Uncharacterized protein n=1 Tax=Gracilariopsis chorda TaxID=448386 RepID=A0A2V3IRH6_9FLOR|nr:hypothetical protein BWQ96_05560 [Gracilariopsis chorda]|eukprot:PXF44703.1 hypothetical protein BWQ96_05560 [Gracilariopsis chorda]